MLGSSGPKQDAFGVLFVWAFSPIFVLFLYFPTSFLFLCFVMSCTVGREKKEERLKEEERMGKGARE